MASGESYCAWHWACRGRETEGQGVVFSDGRCIKEGELERYYLPHHNTCPLSLSLAAAQPVQGAKNTMMDYSTLTPYGIWELLPAHTCAGMHRGRRCAQLHGEAAFAIREESGGGELVCRLEYHRGLSCSVFPPQERGKIAAPSGPI